MLITHMIESKAAGQLVEKKRGERREERKWSMKRHNKSHPVDTQICVSVFVCHLNVNYHFISLSVCEDMSSQRELQLRMM